MNHHRLRLPILLLALFPGVALQAQNWAGCEQAGEEAERYKRQLADKSRDLQNLVTLYDEKNKALAACQSDQSGREALRLWQEDLKRQAEVLRADQLGLRQEREKFLAEHADLLAKAGETTRLEQEIERLAARNQSLYGLLWWTPVLLLGAVGAGAAIARLWRRQF